MNGEQAKTFGDARQRRSNASVPRQSARLILLAAIALATLHLPPSVVGSASVPPILAPTAIFVFAPISVVAAFGAILIWLVSSHSALLRAFLASNDRYRPE